MSILNTYCISILFILSTVQGETIESSFQQSAIDTFELVEEKLNIGHCIQSAQKTAYKETGLKTGDDYYATAWLIMYLQKCRIDTYRSNQFFNRLLYANKDVNNFQFHLNNEIRCLQDKEKDSSVSDTFVKMRTIIDDSLDCFSMKNYQNLYKGMTSWNYFNQTVFVDEGYFSATSDISQALNSANGQILLIIQQMKAVNIAKYVKEKFPYSIEFLGKSGKMFKIQQFVQKENEIKRIISIPPLFWFNFWSKNYQYPKMIIYITEVQDSCTMSGLHRQSVIDKQCQIEHVQTTTSDTRNFSEHSGLNTGQTLVQLFIYIGWILATCLIDIGQTLVTISTEFDNICQIVLSFLFNVINYTIIPNFEIVVILGVMLMFGIPVGSICLILFCFFKLIYIILQSFNIQSVN